VLRELGAAVTVCRVEHLLTHQLPARLAADEKTNLSDSIQTVLNHLGPLLAADRRCVRLTGYHLLTKMVPQLAEQNADVGVRCRCH